jgi:hypothetical protein
MLMMPRGWGRKDEQEKKKKKKNAKEENQRFLYTSQNMLEITV